jgi:hypothetical protein
MAMIPNGLRALQGRRSWAPFAAVIIAFAAGAAAADAVAADAAADVPDQQFAIHGQATYVEQESGSFRAPYARPRTRDYGCDLVSRRAPLVGRGSLDLARGR